ELRKPLPEWRKQCFHGRIVLGKTHQHADAPHPLALLRARRKRPCRRRAAEERDERAASHSITSSALSRNDSWVVRPSALAVARLMIRSNLVGCSIGTSAACPPRRMLSTSTAVRRKRSGKLGPLDLRPATSTSARAAFIVGFRAPIPKMLMRPRLVAAC